MFATIQMHVSVKHVSWAVMHVRGHGVNMRGSICIVQSCMHMYAHTRGHVDRHAPQGLWWGLVMCQGVLQTVLCDTIQLQSHKFC